MEGASDLVRVNTVINEATLRLQITAVKDQKSWPYQIRNLTDKTLNFFQKVYSVVERADSRMRHVGSESLGGILGRRRATILIVSLLAVECATPGITPLPTTRPLS
jgi:hypothetical protein